MKNNNENNLTFGEFLKEKRKSQKISLRELAKLLGISPPYMSDIENDHRNPPDKTKLDKIAQLLNFDQDERNQLYDLAATSKIKSYVVSPDLAEYIMGNEKLRIALRKAKDKKISDKQWEGVIKTIEEL